MAAALQGPWGRREGAAEQGLIHPHCAAQPRAASQSFVLMELPTTSPLCSPGLCPSSQRCPILAGTDTAALAQQPLFALHTAGRSTPMLLLWGHEPEAAQMPSAPANASKGWGTPGKPLSFVLASAVSQKVCSHQLGVSCPTADAVAQSQGCLAATHPKLPSAFS